MLIKTNSFLKKVILFAAIFFYVNIVMAQECPPNIDFENGTFESWTCSNGNVFANGGTNSIALVNSGGPLQNRHTIIARATNIGQTDYYGDFPLNCPNGSAFSVKLGNTNGGHEAEGITYQFTIPANRNTYSLLYNYAVVFQNPNHQVYEQPRLELEVKNVTDNQIIDCSSFTFIPGTTLPGFYTSAITDSVLCKGWTPVTINLNGNAGKTISLTFKTADCTFNKHFGYAYIDVNTECNGEFPGASYCTDDTAINVIGPSGFAAYNWYTNNFTTSLGNAQSLHMEPPPPTGTALAVIVTPYNGYGCVDTLYATLIDTLSYHANAGVDKLLCGGGNTLIGVNPKPGFIYDWTPPLGLSDASISNPIADPPASTQYVVSVRNGGGGCRSKDSVFIRKSFVDTTLNLFGKNAFCSVSNDSVVFVLRPPHTSIQWYKDNNPINTATALRYRALSQGEYFAKLSNNDGCIADTRKVKVDIEIPPRGITYADLYTLKNDVLPLVARDFKGTQLWTPPLYLNNATLLNPDFLSPAALDQLYKIKIVTAAGCAVTDFQTVHVIDAIKIFVPNAFTPNGDALNDFFVPICYGASIKLFKVYNRFGQQVFSYEENEKGWNGKFKGEQQIPGTYVWYLEALGINKKTQTQKGSVILIR